MVITEQAAADAIAFCCSLIGAKKNRHNRFEHMRPMLVKFPLSRSFGICKAAALLHPARTSEQKFFSVLGLRVQKEQIFCKKRQKRS